MKALYFNGPMALIVAVAVSAFRLVKLSGGKVKHCTASADDDAIGATLDYKPAGEAVAFDTIGKHGTLKVEAAGAIASDADTFQAADGKVCALPGDGSETLPAWEASTAYAEGDLIVPTSGNKNDHYYKCTVAGTSASSEPTWPTDGTTVTDGGATWTDMGSSKFKRVGKALQAASAAGSIIGILPHRTGDVVNLAE